MMAMYNKYVIISMSLKSDWKMKVLYQNHVSTQTIGFIDHSF